MEGPGSQQVLTGQGLVLSQCACACSAVVRGGRPEAVVSGTPARCFSALCHPSWVQRLRPHLEGWALCFLSCHQARMAWGPTPQPAAPSHVGQHPHFLLTLGLTKLLSLEAQLGTTGRVSPHDCSGCGKPSQGADNCSVHPRGQGE